MTQNVPSFAELLDSAQVSAVHLELRDQYSVAEEATELAKWRRGEAVDVDPDSEYWHGWSDLVRRAVARGVEVKRARVVSVPVAEYVRYEHHITSVNLAIGEQVRWLPRSEASTLALPGNDFWLVDHRAVRFNLFDGPGVALEPQYSEDPTVIALCATAFEAVWERGVEHEKFTV
ncbi:hypothetical protein KV557_09425 [Kitasatospora aureofaciens]|uniref:DUF6879 family protein n=1 Tax=Kitasatospora aureofaciens TaxID=1894 RepID=UPI001C48E3AB|nr:DUF6879 family protein [Kitasatospora aureofaciens]MBV6697343.1 hypothetical protein [Kitasatospora aureofaciens]